jgi:ABC-type transporter lipoprotein component MlaA
MITKKLLVAAAFLLAATSASLAQGYGYYGAPYGSYGYGPGYGAYNYAPGYGGAYDSYGYGSYYNSDMGRGGSGPRVGPGNGQGIGSQR